MLRPPTYRTRGKSDSYPQIDAFGIAANPHSPHSQAVEVADDEDHGTTTTVVMDTTTATVMDTIMTVAAMAMHTTMKAASALSGSRIDRLPVSGPVARSCQTERHELRILRPRGEPGAADAGGRSARLYRDLRPTGGFAIWTRHFAASSARLTSVSNGCCAAQTVNIACIKRM